MLLAYVDENGAPSLSLRGSIQVSSPTQLWFVGSATRAAG